MNIDNKSDAELTSLKKQIEDELESRKPKTATIYFHRSKEDNFETAQELRLTDDQTAMFMYCGYEIEVKIEVDKDGNACATHFHGIELSKKVSI